MANLNQCNFIGRVGNPPEIRYLPNGDTVATLSIAVTEKWTKDGETKERTEWVRLAFYRKLAQLVEQYVGKGSLIFVSGKLQTRSWENQAGKKKSTTEVLCNTIQFLSPKKETQAKPESEGLGEMPLGELGPDKEQPPF